MLYRVFCSFLLVFFFACDSANSDGDESSYGIWSKKQVEYGELSSFYFNKEMPFITIVPRSYNDIDSFPVMYLLHNYGNSADVFLDSIPNLPELVDKLQIVVVCINSEKGWYIDSPRLPNWRYETYIVNELFPHIKKHYKVFKTGEKTGITGFSMGGFGAIRLGLKYPQMFGYVGSVSGGTDLTAHPALGNLYEVLGSQKQYLNDWKRFSPYYMLDSVNVEKIKFNFHLICGESDFFLPNNKAFSNKLDSLDIDHTYSEIEGIHKWSFARRMIEGQLKDFSRLVN